MRFGQTNLPSWIHQFQPSFFDPLYICAQILALQSAYYFTFSALLWLFNLFSTSSLQLYWIFGVPSYDWRQATGWGLMLMVWLNAFLGCFWVLILIQKSKQVLDFVTTLHVFHAIGTWCYTRSFPWSIGWYLAYLGSLCIMVLGGEHVCIQKETTPIVFNMNPSSTSAATSRWFSWRPLKREHASDENIELNQNGTAFQRSRSSSTLR